MTRFEVEVPDVDPLAWLAAQPGPERLYWRGRDDKLRLAGLGLIQPTEDEQLTNLTELTDAVQSTGAHAIFAGRFDAARAPAEEWAPFGVTRAYVPVIDLVWADEMTRLGCNVPPGTPGRPTDDIATALEELRPATDAAPVTRELRGGAPEMDEPWSDNVTRILAQIADGGLEKAVLARRATYRDQPGLDPVEALRSLAQDQPQTFAFCLQLRRDLAFIGASPELLYRREGRAIQSEALAGTRPRGTDGAGDRQLADELLTSQKDLREHKVVRDHINARLSPLCRQLVAPPTPGLRRLKHVQHLCSEFRGTLADGVGDADLMAQLHPTPAVCGVPTEQARAEIGAREGFDRGLYGGPIGHVGPGGVDCAVAIRSGLLSGCEFFVFAGAGIVEGSNAAAEWDETTSKMQAFSTLLGKPS